MSPRFHPVFPPGVLAALAMLAAVPAAAGDAVARPGAPGPTAGGVAMATIPAGTFPLPFRDAAAADSGFRIIPVPSFRIDVRAASTAEYLGFLQAHPGYRKSSIPAPFADSGYLRTWKGDLQPDAPTLNAPVTAVSWYAAKAYCAAQGKRLPTTAEWERVAATRGAGVDSATHVRTILAWYARSAGSEIPRFGTGTRHAFGVRDLHGVVWEWTSDYNAWSAGGMNRRGVVEDDLSCGGGAARAAPDTDYATYMRWAFRASLQPRYTVAALGFRCAADP